MMKRATWFFLRMKSARSWFTKDLQPKERGRLPRHGGVACLGQSITTCTTKTSHRFATTFDDLFSTRLTSALPLTALIPALARLSCHVLAKKAQCKQLSHRTGRSNLTDATVASRLERTFLKRST